DVPQKLVPQALPLAGAFDEPRQIGHDEASSVRDLDDAEVWCDRRKVIVGDLRLGLGDDRKQRRFAYGRKADQSDIRQHLQLDLYVELLARFAQLTVLRCRVAAGFEMIIATAALSAFCDDRFLSGMCE